MISDECQMMPDWIMDDIHWFSPGKMDDVRWSRNEWWMMSGEALWMRSAASAVAPVAVAAVPVALLLLQRFLSRCSIPLPFGSSAVPSTAGWAGGASQASQPASQPAGGGEEAAVCNKRGLVWFGLVWFGFVLFCFAFPYFLVFISGILLPTARRSAPGTFLFHVPLLLFLFYCCWIQCYNTVVGLVRELFFFLSLANTITALRNVRL